MSARLALRFDAQDHRYYVGDEEVPSVTGILRATGHVDDRWWKDWHRERGKLVHLYCLAIDLGSFHGLAPEHEELAGYVRAYESWLRLARPKWSALEEPVHTAIRRRNGRLDRFAGTLDRLGALQGLNGIVDLKTGVPIDWHSLQTAAYEIAAGRGAVGDLKRWTLYLGKDGRARLRPHDSLLDHARFSSSLAKYYDEHRAA